MVTLITWKSSGDHLALMANFELDIDYPCDVSEALKIATKPEPMSYPMSNIPVRHYGRLLFEAFEELKTMEPGARCDASCVRLLIR